MDVNVAVNAPPSPPPTAPPGAIAIQANANAQPRWPPLFAKADGRPYLFFAQIELRNRTRLVRTIKVRRVPASCKSCCSHMFVRSTQYSSSLPTPHASRHRANGGKMTSEVAQADIVVLAPPSTRTFEAWLGRCVEFGRVPVEAQWVHRCVERGEVRWPVDLADEHVFDAHYKAKVAQRQQSAEAAESEA